MLWFLRMDFLKYYMKAIINFGLVFFHYSLYLSLIEMDGASMVILTTLIIWQRTLVFVE